MRETGSIPTKLGWKVLVLIPKGNTDTWGYRAAGGSLKGGGGGDIYPD